MRKILCLMVFLATLMACTKSSGNVHGKFISNDSTLVFTFVDDTLFVDTYESGCGINAYDLEVYLKASNGEILYKGHEGKSISMIRLSPNPFEGHCSYWIKFDDDKPIPIIKVSP